MNNTESNVELTLPAADVDNPSKRLLSSDAYRRIDREVRKFPPEGKGSAVMAALGIAQHEKGWLSAEVMADVADYLGLPAIAVQEVATFYNMYNLRPVGRHKLTVCTNLPCALSGGAHAGEYLKSKLGVDWRETTADGAFTLLEGECMGACGDAPVMLVNNRRMVSWMSDEKIDALLAELEGAAPTVPPGPHPQGPVTPSPTAKP